MRTSNPVLNPDRFNVTGWENLEKSSANAAPRTMTVQGTVNASFILITLCAASALGVWHLIDTKAVAPGLPMLGGVFGGLVLALIVTFAKKSAPFVAPLYALAEGAALAAISFVVAQQLNAKYQNNAGTAVVFQAVLLTFGIFGALLLAYSMRVIRMGSTATKMVIAGTMGIGLVYLLSMILRMFGINVPFIHDSSPIGIGFSVVVVILASLNLVLDFQFIEEAAKQNQPKYMEWYGAFGLLVTLVWLYLEVLRLLSKLRNK